MAGSELRIRDNIFLASVKLHMHLARDLLSLSLSLSRISTCLLFCVYFKCSRHSTTMYYDNTTEN